MTLLHSILAEIITAFLVSVDYGRRIVRSSIFGNKITLALICDIQSRSRLYLAQDPICTSAFFFPRSPDRSRSVKTKSQAKSWTAQAKVSTVMWWSSKIHIIWYICLSLGKRTQRAVNAARTRLGAHYLKIFAPSHLSLPLILSHDFMLILC